LEIVFSNYSSPRERLRIAERLIGIYRGTPEPLIYADAILNKQNDETPNAPEITLLRAKLILARGFLVVRSHIPRYDDVSLRLAEELLATVIFNPSVDTQAVKLMIDINLSRNDFAAARQLVVNAERKGPLDSDFQYAKAMIEYKAGDRTTAIAILEKLAEADPGYATNELLMAFYRENGDINKLHNYYKRQIQKDPLDAWTLGNYSQFLLVVADDIDGAIKLGSQALRQMDYPMARNTTGLAYLIKASIQYREGKESAAQDLYDAAKSLRYSNDYVRKYCGKYCEQIDRTIKNLKPGVKGVEGRRSYVELGPVSAPK
jgi:tetratricopeptide (TPR) repeat protein